MLFEKEIENVFSKTWLIITCVGCFCGMMGFKTSFDKWTQRVFDYFRRLYFIKGRLKTLREKLTPAIHRWNFFILEPRLLKAFQSLSAGVVSHTDSYY